MRWDILCLLKSLSKEISCHAPRRKQLNKSEGRKKEGNSPGRNGPQRESMFMNQIVSFLVAAFRSVMGTLFTETGTICQNIFTHERHRQMVRDRGRHSLHARGRNFPVLWGQEVKKTKRGRKQKKNKNDSKVGNSQEKNMPHSECGPCTANSSDISLNSRMNSFMRALLHGPLAAQFISEKKIAWKIAWHKEAWEAAKQKPKMHFVPPKSSNVTH